MNAKLLLKTAFLLVVLFFLVLMGRENRGTVDFSLPPVLPHKITLPSDRKSTRLNSSHSQQSRMPSSA